MPCRPIGYLPVGYNGRASSVVVSGTDIIRPNGQTKAPDADTSTFGPCKRLDIELELGALVGTTIELGHPVSVTLEPEDGGKTTICETNYSAMYTPRLNNLPIMQAPVVQ